MLLLATLHPLPPAEVPNGSIAGWIWLTVILAVIVAGGVFFSARR